ncbi:hypothetical protein X975_11415, partial [Stegodyphus mimosarum]
MLLKVCCGYLLFHAVNFFLKHHSDCEAHYTIVAIFSFGIHPSALKNKTKQKQQQQQQQKKKKNLVNMQG